MTTITSKTLFSAFAISAIAGIAMMAQTGAASARSVTSCEGSSRQSVIECCETLVQRKGKPLWMIQARGNCSSAAKCTGSGRQPTTAAIAPPKPCKIVRLIRLDREGGRDNPGNGGRGTPNGGTAGVN